jgi:multiple sugar transport system permease protein/putative aldouronate transport system permease protein
MRLSHEDKIYYIFSYALVCCLVLVVLYPMVYVVSASFSTASMVTSGKVWLLPVRPALYNYSMILQYKSVYTGYRNTFLYTSCGTLINIIFTLLCAYPLSRKDLSGRGFFTFLFTSTMIFSGGMIPSYILMRDLRLINTEYIQQRDDYGS